MGLNGMRGVPPRGHGVGYTDEALGIRSQGGKRYDVRRSLVLALAGWAARLWVVAERSEHLVVLRLEAGTFLLARQTDGRYLLINPLLVPAVLWRYKVLLTVERYRALRTAVARPLRWTRATAHLH